jgi:hypothetical protein
MCAKRSTVLRRIAGKDVCLDPCIVPLIQVLNDDGVRTLACCCGHEKYEPTVVATDGKRIYEVGSNVTIPRIRRFYFKDKDGFFFIPECAQPATKWRV